MCITLWIILILWAAWGYFAVNLLHKNIEKDLKYLFKPKVNLYKRHSSGARYDPIELNKLKVYLGIIFLFPVRLIIGIPFMYLGLLIGKTVWLIFGGKVKP